MHLFVRLGDGSATAFTYHWIKVTGDVFVGRGGHKYSVCKGINSVVGFLAQDAGPLLSLRSPVLWQIRHCPPVWHLSLCVRVTVSGPEQPPKTLHAVRE